MTRATKGAGQGGNMSIIAFIFLSILVIFMLRCLAGLWWIDALRDESCNEIMACSSEKELKTRDQWYSRSNVYFWIFNPLSWYMWTPHQYKKYLKRHKNAKGDC